MFQHGRLYQPVMGGEEHLCFWMFLHCNSNLERPVGRRRRTANRSTGTSRPKPCHMADDGQGTGWLSRASTKPWPGLWCRGMRLKDSKPLWPQKHSLHTYTIISILHMFTHTRMCACVILYVAYTHTHTHIYIYTYLYAYSTRIYMCVCVFEPSVKM